jgi:exodeoxyribonuclease V alpha subunit
VLAAGLERLFPASGDMAPDLQRVAACIAVLRGFTVITGGPGTGKTRTVLRVLALLVEQAIALGVAPPRILLAAPTGKAAARLAESIVAGLATLPCDAAVIAAIPRSAGTLHRSLAWQPRTPTRFRHDASNPLTADVVLVDEASMVDLALMAKLVDAVPAGARLIFLGDRDQLASVEAGSILADVCGEATNRFSATFAARISAVSGETRIDADGTSTAPIADGVVRLVRSHRFRDDGGIGALARAINDGDAGDALRLLGSDGSGEIALVSVGDASVAAREIVRHAVRGYRAALGSEGPEAALRALDRFRVLTAHRGGSLGVAALNGAIVAALVRDGTLPRDARNSSSFAGQPVLITQNDPALGLYNGDAGVVLAELGGVVRVWFRTADGVRGISPARLPAHETAFAMTVHKAQGSEFDEVVLVLPSDVSPVLTRELLYTGVSRARSRVTIIGSPDVMRAGIAERVQRASGLREALWQS